MTNGTWIVEECRLKNPDWENLVTVVVDPELEHTSARSLARELGQVKTLLMYSPSLRAYFIHIRLGIFFRLIRGSR